MSDAIVIRGVTKTFGAKVAVRGLDLSVPSGSLCGFIGPNGAGKTTTIRMIMSIIFPDSGTIEVLGKASAVESKDRIGYLPEERGVYRRMKVLAFLVYMARLKGVDAATARMKSMQWLERMELKDTAKKKCQELSKGMQQKVQFIAAVIHEPELLILDEVFTGLDPLNRKLMRELIEEQHRGGRTIVFSTHAMYEAEQLCDRVFMIHRGVKVLDDTLAGIRAKYDPKTIGVEPLDGHVGLNGQGQEGLLRSLAGVAHVERDRDGFTIGVADGAQPSRVMAEIAAAIPVRRVELRRVNLEDVFINIVQATGERDIRRDELRSTEGRMFKTWLVAWREFLATVLTKGFLLGILLPPVIAGVGFALIPLLMNAAIPKTIGTIAVIDQSGEVRGPLEKYLSPEAFKERAKRKLEQVQGKMKSRGMSYSMDDRTKSMAEGALESAATKLKLEMLPNDADVEKEKKPILEARVRDSDTASESQRVALVVIPAGAVRGTTPPASGDEAKKPAYEHYQMYAAPKLDIEVRGEISDQVDKAIVDARLAGAKFDPDEIRGLTSTPITDSKVVTAEGERSDNGIAAMFVPGAFMILLWVSVLVGGQGLLMSTIEEKSSRVMEVLLSAVSPMQLMVGKIIGQMAVASLILGLYAGTGLGGLMMFGRQDLVEPVIIVYAVIYFVIAFFLMASMMAAIGSVVNDIREAQVLMQPIMLVMVIPMVLWLPISRNPNGTFAQVVSFIPPASPFVMVVRLAGSEKIPFWQVPASMAVGFIAMVFMCWATAKIFRIGVLMYGKPPNFKTLVRWVRMA